MKVGHILVKDMKHFKKLAADGDAEFFMALNGGLRSSKTISYDGNTFYIINGIDGTEQNLTEEQIMDKSYTNIGEALKKKALWYEDYNA